MQRNRTVARHDWREKVESLGLTFHSAETPYWDESVYYSLGMGEVLEIEAATNELFRLCCLAVEHVFERQLWDRFQIPRTLAPSIQRSWKEDDLALYGRFDLGLNDQGIAKLYEFNADTPTSLLEASVVQWYWLRELHPKCDQFNSIHERLIETWKRSEIKQPLHLACSKGSDEEEITTVYIEDTALQAGLKTKRIFMDEIGWNGRRFVDLQNMPIVSLFKLYPWEWMLREPFTEHLPKELCQFIEPPWKMILSNKQLLPLLWEMFPGHPNLLPAANSPESLGSKWIKKPVFGRGGVGITTQTGGVEFSTGGAPEVECGFIYQELCPPKSFDGFYPVIGSWIIGGEAAGLGIRESDTPLTTERSRFVPHLIPQ